MVKFDQKGTGKGVWVFLVLLGGVIWNLTGCGLFDIRDPVEPEKNARVPPRAEPLDPDSVLFNFTWAVRYDIDGLQLYEESLRDAFHLVLDPFDVQELGLDVDSLTRNQDVTAQRRWSQELPDSFAFSFSSQIVERTTDSTAQYLDIPYELQLIRQEGDSLITTETIRGTADLFLLRDRTTTEWALRRWVDQRQDPFKSFGRWHGERAL